MSCLSLNHVKNCEVPSNYGKVCVKLELDTICRILWVRRVLFMELKDAMLGRRSIRFYKTGKISQADIQAIIAAANMAPSWKNSQTPRYYVATSEEAMNKVREALPERNRENTKNAAALIVMTFERGRAGFMKNGSPDNEVGDGWGFFDNGLACQNLVLKAYELGYGSLIMGIRNEQVLRENCSIPASQIITAVISLGVADIDPTVPKRKEVEDMMVSLG